MATMSAEQIQELIAAAVKGALEGYNGGKGGGGGSGGGGKTCLDERHFRRVKVFEGDAKSWKDWVFQFKTQVRSADHCAGSILDKIQALVSGDPDWDVLFVDEDAPKVDKIGAGLFSVLTTLMQGEPLTLIKGVPHGNGWMAFKKLWDRYNPRTLARTLMALMMAMNPKKVTDLRFLSKAVEEWEIAIKNLKAEFGV